MRHVAGQIFLVFLYGFIVLTGAMLSYHLPIQMWRSIRSGSIYINGREVRRSRHPILFWLPMLTIGPYFIWMGLQIDYAMIIKPLWEWAFKR